MPIVRTRLGAGHRAAPTLSCTTSRTSAPLCQARAGFAVPNRSRSLAAMGCGSSSATVTRSGRGSPARRRPALPAIDRHQHRLDGWRAVAPGDTAEGDETRLPFGRLEPQPREPLHRPRAGRLTRPRRLRTHPGLKAVAEELPCDAEAGTGRRRRLARTQRVSSGARRCRVVLAGDVSAGARGVERWAWRPSGLHAGRPAPPAPRPQNANTNPAVACPWFTHAVPSVTKQPQKSHQVP